MVERLPRVLLRLEGLALFAGAVLLYVDGGYSVLALLLLFLAPDVSMAAYLVNPRLGAAAYDAVHTAVLPIALGAFGLLAGVGVAVQLALVWIAHVGLDRAVGYGLKYPSGFKDTHLQRV